MAVLDSLRQLELSSTRAVIKVIKGVFMNDKQKFFLYARKSTDVEDKQVLSIEAQLNELRSFAMLEQIEIVEELIEKKSAKIPGRPIFNKMLAKIEAGEASGILAWHPDRLARNSIDGGKLIYLLDGEKLKSLKFPTFWSDNTSQGKFMLSIAFGQSKYYIDNLAENTKRGLRQKVRRGEYPGCASVGYINDIRTKSIIVDKRRSPIVLSAFELYAKGDQRYEDISIFLKSNGITSKGGKQLTKDQIKRILSNPFYYGHFKYSGEIHEGKHRPIICKKLFDEVQAVLLERGKPQKGKTMPQVFCGLLSCGSCGLMVTAEHKVKHQKNGNTHEYVYYRCTKKRKNMKCLEPAVTEPQLTEQISNLLTEYAMPRAWASKLEAMLLKDEQQANQASGLFVADAQTKIVALTDKLQRLLDGYLDQDIEQNVYREKKALLMSEKKSLEEKTSKLTLAGSGWVEPMRKWINQAVSIRELSKSDNLLALKTQSKEIFGLNLFLKNKKACLSTPKNSFPPLENNWTALRAALQNLSGKSESLVLVRERGLEPPHPFGH